MKWHDKEHNDEMGRAAVRTHQMFHLVGSNCCDRCGKHDFLKDYLFGGSDDDNVDDEDSVELCTECIEYLRKEEE